MSTAGVELPVLPAPLRAINTAESIQATKDTLTMRAGARTDWFIDPAGGAVVYSAPALVLEAAGDWMLSARVSADHRATFDAAVLVVVAAETVYAKLCLELSPQGVVTVVSVVTRGTSDDCNSVPAVGSETSLRISSLGRAFAFHHSPDGKAWDLIRYFDLGEDAGQTVNVGFLAQAPTGQGCTARFRQIAFVRERLAELRGGL